MDSPADSAFSDSPCGSSTSVRSTSDSSRESSESFQEDCELSDRRAKRVKCPICGKFYASKKSLKIHNRIHTGYKPYKCEYCAKSFSQTNVLKAHINAHTGQRDWCCSMCPKRFTQSAHLRTHEKTHYNRKDFRCNHCEKTFSSKGVRDRHVRQHTGEKPFQCHQCHKQFTRGESLRFHLNAHKGIRPYRCTIGNCSSNFTKQSSLKRHIKACHTPSTTTARLEDADLADLDVEAEVADDLRRMSAAELDRHFAENATLLENELGGEALQRNHNHSEMNHQSPFIPQSALSQGLGMNGNAIEFAESNPMSIRNLKLEQEMQHFQICHERPYMLPPTQMQLPTSVSYTSFSIPGRFQVSPSCLYG